MSPPPRPTPIATSLPEGSGPIDDLPIAYDFYAAPEDLPAGDLLLYVDPEQPDFRYLTWDGRTGPLLRIDVLLDTSAELLELGEPTFAVVRSRGNRRYLAISPLNEATSRSGPDRPNAQIYIIFDLLERHTQGFNAACGAEAIARNEVVGPTYLTYQCSNYKSTIAFVPLDDPAGAFGRTLPEPLRAFYDPIWLSADELLITGYWLHGSKYCLARPLEWSPVCGEVPYFIMSASPDGEFVEVREGDDRFRPSRIGVLDTACLRNPTGECEPTWTQAEGVIGWSGETRSLMEAGAWTPDTAGYVVLNGSGPPDPSRPTTAWYLDIAAEELLELATIPLSSISVPTAHGDPEGGVSSSFWSPDGEWLLLQGGGGLFWWAPRPLYLLSREAGRLRPLLQDAGQVVGDLAVP